MSLINEALRRTRDAAYQNAARPSTPAAEYRLEPKTTKETGPGRARLVLTVGLSLLALGGLLYATYQFSYVFPRARMDHYMPATMTPPPVGPDAVPEHLRTPVVAPVELPETLPVASPPPAPVSPVPVAAPVEVLVPVAPPPPPAPPAELPKLVIQGFSSVGNLREVMINGRMLRVGDTIMGAKIIFIERPVVRVAFDGREVELPLP